MQDNGNSNIDNICSFDNNPFKLNLPDPYKTEEYQFRIKKTEKKGPFTIIQYQAQILLGGEIVECWQIPAQRAKDYFNTQEGRYKIQQYVNESKNEKQENREENYRNLIKNILPKSKKIKKIHNITRGGDGKNKGNAL